MREVGVTCLCGVRLRDSWFSSSRISPSQRFSRRQDRQSEVPKSRVHTLLSTTLLSVMPIQKWKTDFGKTDAGGKKSQREGVDIRGVRGLNPELSPGGSGNHRWSQAEDC